MPRKPRNFIRDNYYHITHRGNAQQTLFYMDMDRAQYLQYLKRAATMNSCSIHAFVLMSNHFHLIASQSGEGSISGMMCQANSSYAKYLIYHRRVEGKVWDGRFKDKLIDDEAYLLNCMAYIDLNPVRAGLCESPGEYAWSSYRRLAIGESDMDFLEPASGYTALHRHTKRRRSEYARYVLQVLKNSMWDRDKNRAPRTPPGSTDLAA